MVYDAKLQKVFKFNNKGKKLLSFGGQGRGPGKFQMLIDYWVLNKNYLLYDLNGSKLILYDSTGTHLNDYPVDRKELTMSIEALSLDRFVTSTNIEEDSLLKFINIKNNNITYFGKLIAKKIKLSKQQISNTIDNGIIPNNMQNDVSIGANKTGIYSFQVANAILQKYNLNGRLLWERNLKATSVADIYRNFLKKNRESNKIYSLTYLRDMHVTKYGVAILFNTSKGHPATVIWIPNNGNNIQVVNFPNIDVPSTYTLRFRLSPDLRYIFFVNSLKAKVYRSNWPISIK